MVDNTKYAFSPIFNKDKMQQRGSSATIKVTLSEEYRYELPSYFTSHRPFI